MTTDPKETARGAQSPDAGEVQQNFALENSAPSPSSSSASSYAAPYAPPCPLVGKIAARLEAGLYLVATPIGNLRDITLRALDVLAAADVVYAEDTRNTQKLLAAFSLQKRLTAYHDHNAAARIPGILAALAAGKSVALVSDAGTPLVSDPGFKLARAAAAAGHRIIPLPGASAVLAGLLTSALPSDQFLFAGFLPARSDARRGALGALSAVPATLVFFESGARIAASLTDMIAILGEREAAIARELTKTYEETRRGTLSALLEGAVQNPPRGEIVIIVGPPDKESGLWDEARLEQELGREIAASGVKRAANQIAALSGHPRREVYARALALKDKM